MSAVFVAFRCPNPECHRAINIPVSKLPEDSGLIPSDITLVECDPEHGGCGWHGTARDPEFLGPTEHYWSLIGSR